MKKINTFLKMLFCMLMISPQAYSAQEQTEEESMDFTQKLPTLDDLFASMSEADPSFNINGTDTSLSLLSPSFTMDEFQPKIGFFTPSIPFFSSNNSMSQPTLTTQQMPTKSSCLAGIHDSGPCGCKAPTRQFQPEHDSLAACEFLFNQNFLDEPIDFSSVFAFPTATELSEAHSIDLTSHAPDSDIELSMMNQSQKQVHDRKKSHQCDECQKSFNRSSHLTLHKRTHTGKKPYQCNQCDYRCSQSSNLKTHQKKHHTIGTQLPHYQNLQQASTINISQPEQSALSNGAAPETIETTHPIMSMAPESNPFSSAHFTHTTSTLLTKVPSESFPIDELLPTISPFALAAAFNRSMNQPTLSENQIPTKSSCLAGIHPTGPCGCRAKRPFEEVDSFAPCERLSNQNFSSKVLVLSSANELSKDHSIDLADNAPAPETELSKINQSQEQVHGSEKSFACNQCDYRCLQPSYLKRHQLIHTGEKPYQCSQCEYRCSHSSDLTKHKRIHSSEKPFTCNVCNTSFTVLSTLKTHKRTHTRETPYQCNQCDYHCSQSSHLKTHKRTHTRETPYQCNQCDYRCSQSSHLTIHQLIHTGEKPYQCNQCDYRCSQSSNLKKHQKKHHPIGTQLPHYQNLQQPSAISTNQVEQSPFHNGATEATDQMELESQCLMCGNDTETCKCEQPLS